MSSNKMFSMNTSYSSNCNSKCSGTYNSLYDGSIMNPCIQCPTGPTGPSGDKYLSYFSTTFYSNKLYNGVKTFIKIDKYLSYVPNNRIYVQVLTTDEYPTIYRFQATVVSYDPQMGVLLFNETSGLTSSFPYGQLRNYLVNIYYSPLDTGNNLLYATTGNITIDASGSNTTSTGAIILQTKPVTVNGTGGTATSTGGIQINASNILSNTAGSSSSQYLIVNINGIAYKISLLQV